jgi:hypothetical protein
MASLPKTYTSLGFVFGVIFLSAILILAVFIPQPSDFQYQVFRIVLALAAGGVGAVIPGILNVNIPKVLTAGGALAVFAVVYFYSPAQLAVKQLPQSVAHDEQSQNVACPRGYFYLQSRATDLFMDLDEQGNLIQSQQSGG